MSPDPDPDPTIDSATMLGNARFGGRGAVAVSPDFYHCGGAGWVVAL